MNNKNKNIILVKVYKKTNKGWVYWTSIGFSDFKYFVEIFITRLLEKGYKYYKDPLYIPLDKKKGQLLEDWEGIYNDKEGLLYIFKTDPEDLKWATNYIEAWHVSKEIADKDKKKNS